MLCTASDTFKILTYSKLSLFRYMQAYSRMFSIIKAYSGLFRHIEHLVQPSNIHNLVIFRALAYLKLKVDSKPYETLTRHIQNSTKVGNSGIIQPYSCILEPCLMLAYAETGHSRDP